MSDTSTATSTAVDPNFIKSFIMATVGTLKVQCQTETKVGKPHLKGVGPELQKDICGLIGLTSNKVTGTIALCFPAQTFLNCMSSMLGETFAEITKELEDGVGELLNIIFGQAKISLNDGSGYDIEKAIPSVVRGTDIQVRHLTSTPAVVLPFESNMGLFHLEIALEVTKQK